MIRYYKSKASLTYFFFWENAPRKVYYIAFDRDQKVTELGVIKEYQQRNRYLEKNTPKYFTQISKPFELKPLITAQLTHPNPQIRDFCKEFLCSLE